ncbi:uncharacterized protein AB9W97_009165 [Spinachia spinachia]
MIPAKHLKFVGLMPLERFVTTYSRDYKPFSECHLQVNQPRPRCEAAAAPAHINTVQNHRETWPVLFEHFYKTSNSIYGSTSWPQPPTCSCFLPGSLHPLGVHPSMSSFPLVGSPLTEAGTQEMGAEREIGPLPGEEKKAKMLEQQEVQDVLWKKSNVRCEESVISCHVGPAYLPVASIPIVTTRDAENWVTSGCRRNVQLAVGLVEWTFIQNASRQRSCCAWETENPRCCCFEKNTFPPCIHPVAHAQPTFCNTEPSRMLPLTEYQASYSAGWAQLRMQRRDIHHHQAPRHLMRYPPL